MREHPTPPHLAPRATDAHKASVGKVLVVGGCRDMCGAPALAALGALRAGAGLVRIAVPRQIQGIVATMRPEAMTAGLPDTDDGELTSSAEGPLREIAAPWDAVVMGPGAGRAIATVMLLRGVASNLNRPLVLDADGLFALGAESGILESRKRPTVITPHEGEASRLLDVSTADVRGDRPEAARELARRTGAVVVLKGPGTLVTDGRRLYRNETGGPYLASGGTGDVLSGVVGAFLAGIPATGADAFEAACAAAYVHGLAADTLAWGVDRGLLASEVANGLPRAIATLVRSVPSEAESQDR